MTDQEFHTRRPITQSHKNMLQLMVENGWVLTYDRITARPQIIDPVTRQREHLISFETYLKVRPYLFEIPSRYSTIERFVVGPFAMNWNARGTK